MIDVAPTILEVAGLPQPTIVNSAQQAPMEGVSMAYSFDDALAARRRCSILRCSATGESTIRDGAR